MADTAHSIAYQTDNALWSSTCAARHLSLADLNEIRERAIAALSSPKAGEPVFPPRE
jgi:hypothetical protein